MGEVVLDWRCASLELLLLKSGEESFGGEPWRAPAA